MIRQLRKYLIWALAIGAFYFVLSHHFIVIGRSVKMLKKAKLSLNYTIFSTKGMSNKAILSIPELREVGIGKLLLQSGRITETELEAFMDQLREKEEEEEDY
jgi:hypothetical protein